MKFLLFSYAVIVLLSACTTRPTPVPKEYKNELAFGAVDIMNISSRKENSIYNSLGSAMQQCVQLEENPSFSILALSGGGSRGAFGTGFVDAWFESKKMPYFNTVTGVSTGAIMAPFVFLHDKEQMDTLKYFYTHSTTEDVFANDWFSFVSGYVANAKPLEKILDSLIDEEFLDKIAKEYNKGRRLYIGTTNLDTGKFTVWDMGAIAASHYPNKLAKFKKIILASSALPAFVPPQYIKIQEDGKDYYQMHVDGGVYNQIFVVGILEDWSKLLQLKHLQKTQVTLYLVSNRKYRQRDYYQPVKQNLVDIVKAYVLTEMDLLFDKSTYRIYMAAKAKGYAFKMVAIPNNMKPIIENPTQFEPQKLQKLFDMGYNMGMNPEWIEKVSYDEYDKL